MQGNSGLKMRAARRKVEEEERWQPACRCGQLMFPERVQAVGAGQAATFKPQA